MSIRVLKPVDVVDAPDITISEYVGRVASQDPACSACVATIRQATKELPQCPAFDEYVLVLEGEVHIMHGPELKECTVVKVCAASPITRSLGLALARILALPITHILTRTTSLVGR